MERWRKTALAAERAWADQEVTTAIRLYRKAAAEAERAGQTVMRAVVLNNLGLAFDQAGDGLAARDTLRTARDLLTAAEDGGDYLAAVLRTLGGVEVELGDIDAAIATQRAALALARTRGDAEGVARARTGLGIALKDAGRLSEARDELTAALEMVGDPGLKQVRAHALTALGLVSEKLHRPAQAREHYAAALPLYEELADHGNAAAVLYNLASLHDGGVSGTRRPGCSTTRMPGTCRHTTPAEPPTAVPRSPRSRSPAGTRPGPANCTRRSPGCSARAVTGGACSTPWLTWRPSLATRDASPTASACWRRRASSRLRSATR